MIESRERNSDDNLPSESRFLKALRESIAAMIETILIVILVLALVGALPTWPHSRTWGYYPTGGLGLILLIVIILLLLGRI